MDKDKNLNKFLSKVRAPVEHPYAVIKRIFHGGRVLVTTSVRVKIKWTFVCTSYNLFRALTLLQLTCARKLSKKGKISTRIRRNSSSFILTDRGESTNDQPIAWTTIPI